MISVNISSLVLNMNATVYCSVECGQFLNDVLAISLPHYQIHCPVIPRKVKDEIVFVQAVKVYGRVKV
jgi:hypothetical protein